MCRYDVTSNKHVTVSSAHIFHKIHFMLLTYIIYRWTNMATTLQIKVTLPSFCMGISI